MKNALEIKNLSKKYGKNLAVKKLNLDVPEGQFFGFLGPNGAGKSSTIHCITGIATISSGSIKIFDQDVVNDYRLARRQVGLAPQESNIDIFMETWRILDYMAGYYGLNAFEREQRIKELLEQFDLIPHKDKRYRELSGGLKRRVMLARAMVHNPPLLILDEPTAGVDVELRHEIWKHLKQLNKDGKTIILTSHYLEEVEQLCERVAIMNHGEIIADKKIEEFTSNGNRLEQAYLKLTKGTHA